MSRRPARYTEADLNRAMREAAKRGENWGVEIPPGPNPQIRVFMAFPANHTPKVIDVDPRPRDNGWVYFIRAVQTGRIKIGFSLDPRRRLRELEFGCPEDLELIVQIPGSFTRERNLHRRFTAHRARGEWFEPAVELLEFVNSLATSVV